MALTPNNDTVFLDDLLAQEQEAEETVEPSKTYSIDFEGGKIGRQIDGLDAIKQFVIKALITPRDRFIAYDDNYGCEIDNLIGTNVTYRYIETEIPRMIRDALIYDDRIDNVTGFEFERDRDALFVSFNVEVNPEALLIADEELSAETITVLRFRFGAMMSGTIYFFEEEEVTR